MLALGYCFFFITDAVADLEILLNAAKDEDKLPLGAGSQPGWKKWATKLNRLLGRDEGSASALTSFDVCQKVYDAAKKEETTGGEDTADQEELYGALQGVCRYN